MKKFLFFLFALFLASGVAVSAHDSKNLAKNDIKIDIKNKVENGSNFFRLQVNNSKFHLRGKVSSVDSNSFIIDGVSVKYDPSLVERFKQKGQIKIGSFLKVQGEVKNNQFLAVKIDVKDEDDDDDEDENEDPETTPTTTTTPTVTPIPTEAVNNPTPSVTPTGTVTPAPTAGVAIEEVKMNLKVKGGTLENIIKFLENLLSLLKSSPNA